MTPGAMAVLLKSVSAGLDRSEIRQTCEDQQSLENGAQGRNRTTDTAIFSRMLYQLSYLGP